MEKVYKKMNDQIRKKILERDKYRCQLDRLFGISEISGVPCSKRLEVHHKTYKRAKGNKEFVKDGITVCLRCHILLTDMIRGQRYSVREYSPKDIEQKTPKFKIRRHENAKVSMQDCRDYSPNYAQGRDGRPFRPFYKGDQSDLKKEDEDRS